MRHRVMGISVRALTGSLLGSLLMALSSAYAPAAMAAETLQADAESQQSARSYEYLLDHAQEFRRELDESVRAFVSARDTLSNDAQLARAIGASDRLEVIAALTKYQEALAQTQLTIYNEAGAPFAVIHFDSEGRASLDQRSQAELAAQPCRPPMILGALLQHEKPFLALAEACEDERAAFATTMVLLAAARVGAAQSVITLTSSVRSIESLLRKSHTQSEQAFHLSIIRSDGAILDEQDARAVPAWLQPPLGSTPMLAANAMHASSGLFVSDDTLDMLVLTLAQLSEPNGQSSALLICADPKLIRERVLVAVSDDGTSSMRLAVRLLVGLAVAVAIVLFVRRRHLATTKVLNHAADEALQERNRLISGVSHDIRGPLSAIMGYAELIHKDASYLENGPLRDNAFDAIKRSCQFIVRLTDHLLDLRSATMGKLALETRCTDVLAICDECVATYALEAREKNLGLHFAHPGIERLKIFGDPTRLRQIVQNLVGNAVRYSDRGSVTLALWIPDPTRYEIEISVSDTGIGISAEGQAKIFEPFFREKRPEGSPRSGTGLGLAVVKSIVDALGGTIDVRSELGKGSSFVVRIPGPPWVEADQSAPLRRSEPVPVLGAVATSVTNDASQPLTADETDVAMPALIEFGATLQGLRIAFADDYPEAREITGYLLRTAGATVSAFPSGTDLVHAIQCGLEADCVLLDLQMPGLSGHDSALLLRKSGYSGPMIAISALADERVRARSIQCGFAEHLTKPGDPMHLQEVIARLTSDRMRRS